MRPSSFSVPILANIYVFLEFPVCGSLPVPIAAYIAFSNTRRKYAIVPLVFLLPALAIAFPVWMDYDSPASHALMIFFNQFAFYILLVALRFRGVRRNPDG